VDSCPTGALRFGEESEFAELIARAQVMKPELGTKPRVYYVNIPKRFIAGTVYDPVEKEVVIGAAVTAAAADGTTCSVQTDAFGDFWLEGLEPGEYTVTIEAEGFGPATCVADATADVGLGDIPMPALGSAAAAEDAGLGDVALSH
jgi:hypothetical protein